MAEEPDLIRISRKDGIMFASAYIVCLPALVDNAASVFYPCFVISWGLLIYICFAHAGPILPRLLWGVFLTVVFLSIGICHYYEIDKNEVLREEIKTDQEQVNRNTTKMLLDAAANSPEIIASNIAESPVPPLNGEKFDLNAATQNLNDQKMKAQAKELQLNIKNEELAKANAKQLEYIIETFRSYLTEIAATKGDSVVWDYKGILSATAGENPPPVLIGLKSNTAWKFSIQMRAESSFSSIIVVIMDIGDRGVTAPIIRDRVLFRFNVRSHNQTLLPTLSIGGKSIPFDQCTMDDYQAEVDTALKDLIADINLQISLKPPSSTPDKSASPQ